MNRLHSTLLSKKMNQILSLMPKIMNHNLSYAVFDNLCS